MSSPAHLSNHHRNTLAEIFQHPTSHNIEWRAVLSLLEAVGTAVDSSGGKLAVTVGARTEYFDAPRDKDIDTQTVIDLRHLLSEGGYGPDGTPA